MIPVSSEKTVVSGSLYLVSTPIGHLQDITFRAVEILRQVDLIAAEDTRTSRVLLQQYAIQTPLTSYHEHNEQRMAPVLVNKLTEGGTVALITDAGTPGISDPGFYLVRAALQAGCAVVPVPGASAVLAALVASGLPCERFVFEGFLPHKKGRQKRLGELREDPRTLVFYEAPTRIERTCRDLLAALGDRRVVIARELTKKFEQIIRGQLAEVVEHLDRFPHKGEFVIVVAGASRKLNEE